MDDRRIKTKIICTIGPETESFEMLQRMAGAGMNIARLNMSHGDHDWHKHVIKLIKTLNRKIKIIAKIEDEEEVKNVNEIIAEVDGVMVARGDLGIQIPIHTVPTVQPQIVRSCAEQGKRVIVATDLLESMITNPIPTRAEVTDVVNAVFEEVDAMMMGRGIRPFRIAFSKDPEKTLQTAFNVLKEREGFQSEEKVVVISDVLAGSGKIDAIQIRHLP